MEQYIISKMIKGYTTKIDDVLIQGLALKGFIFSSQLELREFVKNNCNCIYDSIANTKMYYVNCEPFLLYDFNNEINSIMGSYKYL